VIRDLLNRLTGRKKLNEERGSEVEGVEDVFETADEHGADFGYATLEITDEHRTTSLT
jgi:hypothetical protein